MHLPCLRGGWEAGLYRAYRKKDPNCNTKASYMTPFPSMPASTPPPATATPSPSPDTLPDITPSPPSPSSSPSPSPSAPALFPKNSVNSSSLSVNGFAPSTAATCGPTTRHWNSTLGSAATSLFTYIDSQYCSL